MLCEQYYYDWMVNKKGLKKSVAQTNLSRIRRIDAVYDLDYAFINDGCSYVLSLFEYSTKDERNGLVPEHDIVIVGNYYTGTQSLKSALNLFIEANEDDKYFDEWISTQVSTGGETGITDDEFKEVINSFRDMGPIKVEKIRGILKEQKAPSKDASCVDASDDSKSDCEPQIIFKGSLQAFLRYVGPFCKNYVNSITKSARSKHNGICEYCGSKAVLDSAHRNGEDRPIIIEKILESYFKKSDNYYEVDILKFENLFKNAHMPVADHIFFLCKKCHGEYDKSKKITTADILAKRKP